MLPFEVNKVVYNTALDNTAQSTAPMRTVSRSCFDTALYNDVY